MKIFNQLFNLVLFLAVQTSLKASTNTPGNDFCFDQPSSKRQILFFTGMLRSEDQSPRKYYEQVLKKIAIEQNLSVYMPQNTRPCVSDKKALCWPRQDPPKSVLIIQDLIEQAKSCFKHPIRLELHGHSNGAYFIFDALQGCELSEINKAVLIAGGSLSHRNRIEKSSQDCHRELYFAAGEKDKIFPKLKELAQDIDKKPNIKSQFISLPGGHDLTSAQYGIILKASGSGP